jgi:hypothetical protein
MSPWQQDPEGVVEKVHRAGIRPEGQWRRLVVVHDDQVDAAVGQLHQEPLHVVVADRHGHARVSFPHLGHRAWQE